MLVEMWLLLVWSRRRRWRGVEEEEEERRKVDSKLTQ